MPVPPNLVKGSVGVKEFARKSAASIASPDYLKFGRLIMSAASSASLGRLRYRPWKVELVFLVALESKETAKLLKLGRSYFCLTAHPFRLLLQMTGEKPRHEDPPALKAIRTLVATS